MTPNPLIQTKSILADLIAFPTVSADSNLALIDYVADLLSTLGAKVAIHADPTGRKANLFATFGPATDGGLVLSGHSDVVPITDQNWSTDPFQLTEQGGRLYGRGACDMKGFIACTLALAPDFAAWPLARPLHIALTYDEEVGCLGGQALAAALLEHGPRPAVAIIGEPTSMRVIEGHKGCCEYTTRIRGLEGHGSAPDRGVNAAEAAARYVGKLIEIAAALRARTPDGPFDPPWTTINTGRIEAGAVHNVIPGRAEIDWEMRPVNDEDRAFALSEIDTFAETLTAAMQTVSREAGIARETIAEVAGLSPTTANEARDIVSALTGANGADLVAFGTEAGLFQSLGMDCVVCGPGSIEQAHKPDEFVAVDQLAACLEMLTGLERYITE